MAYSSIPSYYPEVNMYNFQNIDRWDNNRMVNNSYFERTEDSDYNCCEIRKILATGFIQRIRSLVGSFFTVQASGMPMRGNLSDFYQRVMFEDDFPPVDRFPASQSYSQKLLNLVRNEDLRGIYYTIKEYKSRKLNFNVSLTIGLETIETAIGLKRLDIFLLLIPYVNMRDIDEIIMFAYDCHCGQFVEESLLRFAIASGKLNIIEKLIKSKADLNCRENNLKYGQQILQIICTFPILIDGKPAIVEGLSRMGISFDCDRIDKYDNRKVIFSNRKPAFELKPIKTPLVTAIINKQLEVVERLFKARVDFCVKSQDEFSIKEAAEKMGIGKEVKVLIDKANKK